jgi:hypothetical protein
MLSCGDTFYASDDEDVEPHLFVIITPPHEGDVITVSVTTRRQKSEALVILKVGDHPFIKWESVVSYRHAQIRKLKQLEAAIDSGLAAKREPISGSLLRRIRMGLMESEFTEYGVLHFYLDLKISDDE